MHKMWVLLLVVFAAVTTAQKSSGATPQERADIVGYHNKVRASVNPPASNMMAMVRILELTNEFS